ncbi:MAG: hypothetical protein N2037_05345 [Acidimicrobiales bacterium]|nr:hypothetical protein [Acidimicrobiales bacterium]
MVVAILVFATGILVALGWACSLYRALRSARDQVAALELEVAASKTETEGAKADAAAARAEATSASAAADAARADAATARELAERERTRADRAERAVNELTQRVTDLGEWAAAVLAIEMRRIDRLWRDRLSLPGEPSPLERFDDPAAAAAMVFAELSREDRGVAIDVTWTLESMPTPELTLALIKVVEELIAAAALADGGTMVAAGGNGEIVIRLDPEPPIDPPVELTAALASLGWALRREGGSLLAVPV